MGRALGGARDLARCSTRSASSGSRSSGRRFGGPRLAATLAFAWAAYPFTLYASNSNTNDAIMPALPDLGVLARELGVGARRRGRAGGLDEVRRAPARAALALLSERAPGAACAGSPSASPAATVAAFLILLLEPEPLHAARVFAERTFGFQLDRDSPFSIWGWGQYHAAGVPDLHVVQQVVQVLVVAGAVLAAFVPRQKSILQLAALTAAILIGFELVLTHWFYLYIPWFFPFVAFALLYRRDRAAQVH